jgi:antitoxin (DNA-binding transcriptional repressor) of toxin-antitoxin stability system
VAVMDSVGVGELRENLGVYLSRVREGEALRITEQGLAVALLTPLPRDDEPFADLIATGRARPARHPFHRTTPLEVPDDGGPPPSQVLRDARAEDTR